MKRLMALAMALCLVLCMGWSAAEEEETVITAFLEVADASWDYSQNYTLNMIAERTGVRLDTTGYVFASSEAPTQKQLILASGKYPEIFLMRDAGAFTYAEIYQYGVKDGYFIPIQDLIKENAPRIQAIFDAQPEYVNMHTAPDGNMYAVTRFSECQHARGYYKMYINADWLDKLGLEMPTTLAELKDVLIAFRDQDPNGNGIADEIPLTARADNLFTGYFMNSFIATDFVKGKRLAEIATFLAATRPSGRSWGWYTAIAKPMTCSANGRRFPKLLSNSSGATGRTERCGSMIRMASCLKSAT